MKFKANMGLADRIIRLLLVVVIALLYFSGVISGSLAIILGIFALAFLVTSLVAFCPLYIPLRISTRGKKSK